MAEELTFTLKEISEATGILDKTLSGRVRAMRKAKELPEKPEGEARTHFTYDEVRKLIQPRKVGKNGLRPAYVDALKRKLLNDGYPIKKKETTAK